jgi:hypothetical protein
MVELVDMFPTAVELTGLGSRVDISLAGEIGLEGYSIAPLLQDHAWCSFWVLLCFLVGVFWWDPCLLAPPVSSLAVDSVIPTIDSTISRPWILPSQPWICNPDHGFWHLHTTAGAARNTAVSLEAGRILAVPSLHEQYGTVLVGLIVFWSALLRNGQSSQPCILSF